jgi:hypothetical protein
LHTLADVKVYTGRARSQWNEFLSAFAPPYFYHSVLNFYNHKFFQQLLVFIFLPEYFWLYLITSTNFVIVLRDVGMA